MDDIKANSFLFGYQNMYVEDMGLVYNSPLVDKGIGQIFNMTAANVARQSVGCSDDRKFKQTG